MDDDWGYPHDYENLPIISPFFSHRCVGHGGPAPGRSFGACGAAGLRRGAGDHAELSVKWGIAHWMVYFMENPISGWFVVMENPIVRNG